MIRSPNYQLIELDSSVHDYLIEMLQSGKELSHLILKEIQFDNGFVFTILPENFEGDIHEYEYGGKLPPIEGGEKIIPTKTGNLRMVPIPNTNEALVNLISEFLKSQAAGLSIFEDAMRWSTAPVILDKLKKKDEPLFILNDSVYYCLTAFMTPDLKAIENTVQASKSLWHFVCLLTLTRSTFNKNQKLTNEMLEEFVGQTQGIIFTVYDGESYIIWSPEEGFIKMLRQLFSTP